MEKQNKHGGSRVGAGRKKIREQMNFHIDLELVDKVKSLKSRNNFINAAIREKFARIESIIKDAKELE